MATLRERCRSWFHAHCKAANSPPFSMPLGPAALLSPPSAVVPSSDSPRAETSRTTSCTKPPHPPSSYTTPPPSLSSETALPIPPPPPSALAPASIPLAPLPKLCLPTFSIPPPSYHFTHRYAHALRLPPLSPASIALLVSTSTTPVISWLSEHLSLACKAGKNTSAGCFQAIFNGRAIPTCTLCRSKGANLRIRLTGNGITIQELPAYTIFSQKLPEWKGGFWGALRGRRPARRVGGRQKESVYAAKWY